MSQSSKFTVSADWLEQRLDQPGLSIIDGSWYLPAQNRNAREEYYKAHIPGAVFFDQDEVVDPESKLPHTLPDPLLFEQYASSMGVTHTDTIVVYDGLGMFTAPRVWWMFRVMGAKEVFVLDGGFDAWKADGRPVTDEKTKIAPSAFIPEFDKSKVTGFSDMLRIVNDGSCQIADARSPGRFSGEEAEPRAGMRSGHMPGASNVPVFSLSDNGVLKSSDELRDIFEKAGIDLDKPVITTCGSGVTAAVITLALAELGHEDNALYDGSWSEWGGREDTPVITG